MYIQGSTGSFGFQYYGTEGANNICHEEVLAPDEGFVRVFSSIGVVDPAIGVKLSPQRYELITQGRTIPINCSQNCLDEGRIVVYECTSESTIPPGQVTAFRVAHSLGSDTYPYPIYIPAPTNKFYVTIMTLGTGKSRPAVLIPM